MGAVSAPDIPLSLGRWQVVGRREPMFTLPGANGTDSALDDPSVSRKQLRVRWVEATWTFEVEPIPGAKRRLFLVPMDSRSDPHEITERMQVAPGSCVAIGNQALIGLDLGTSHEPTADRMGFVGESEVMWRLREDILSVTAFDRPVLVTGPTGVGKELVASSIHQAGPRAEEPLVIVNCAALPEHLVESILFGHKRGAFTGAETTQEGMFRAADGGTLFLDELGELPMSVQPKLLRALQEGEVLSVGRHTGIEVDVRLIAATNRVLEDEVAAGRMREDLYHRVAGHILRVPPLHERKMDIPALFVHFLKRLHQEHPDLGWMWSSAWQRVIPIAFFIELMRARWTGNVRALENVVERVARLSLRDGRFVAPELPGAAPQPDPPTRPPTPHQDPERDHLAEASDLLNLAAKTVAKLLEQPLTEQLWRQADEEGWDEERLTAQLHESARETLFQTLTAHGFKQVHTARALGVAPTTLHKLMERFGLPRPTDLSRETIEEALAQADGDFDAAARRLRVSAQGLRRRLSLLNLKRHGS